MASVRLMAGLAAAAALVWSWSAPSVYAQEQEGARVVEGQLVNGTAGGSDLLGVPITLHIEGATRHDHLLTATGPQGRFRFKEVAFEPDTTYGVSVVYQGGLYGSDLDLSNGSPPPVSLTVYEADASQASLSITSASVLFAQVDKASQTLWALEIMRVENGTDRTYVPGPEPMRLLRFSLPPGAQALQVDTDLMGADVLQVDRGFALTASVPPGEHEVMYAYQFPYSGNEDMFVKSLPFGADSVRVLAAPEIALLSSRLLLGPEAVDIGGRSYQLLTAADLPPDSDISLELSGLPEATLGDRVDRRLGDVPWEYGAPLALGLMMVSLVAVTLWRRGSRGASRLVLAGASTPQGERGRIVEMIAELDEAHDSAAHDDAEYRRRRAALTTQLAALARRGPAQPD